MASKRIPKRGVADPVEQEDFRRVSAALVESEGRFRRMADATLDVIWITDLEPEMVVYVSPSFERIWGRKAQDLYDNPHLWIEAIHPEDRDGIGKGFGEWISAQPSVPWQAEYRILQPGGGVRWIIEHGVVISEVGGPKRVSGISKDVTDHRLMASALRESEERFALAVAGSNDGLWDWDIPSDRMFLSDRAQRIYGLQPGETQRARAAWRALICLHPEDVADQNRKVAEYLAGTLPAYDGEWRVRDPDGGFRWIRIRGVCVRDAQGRPTRMAGSVSDIDAHKRAQAALQQAQRLEALGTLAGGIAHDFNNILGAILGFGEMTLRSARSGSRLRRDLESIMTAGERGRSLVERILAFSRSGVTKRVPVQIESVVREAVDLLSRTVPEGLRVDLELHAGNSTVRCDGTKIHQVVINLVTNAIQAMPDGGTLRVAMELALFAERWPTTTGDLEAGEYVLLSVSDNGSGIDPVVKPRIFDPFFTTKDPGGGTGLGLSLVHGIVTELGGAIDVQTSAGLGSTFKVYLPRHGEMPVAQPSGPRARVPRGSQQQVLVVDDEEALVRLTTERLGQLGYVCVGYTSSADALVAFQAHPERFDAIVTDERMPGLSGVSLIKAARSVRADIPALLVSGYMGEDLVERAHGAGATRVLGKPSTADDLAVALAAALATQSAASAVSVARSAAMARAHGGRSPG